MNEIEYKYPIGKIIQGQVVNKQPFGVFIDVGEDVSKIIGLIHLPQLIEKGYSGVFEFPEIGKYVFSEIIDVRKSIKGNYEIYLSPDLSTR